MSGRILSLVMLLGSATIALAAVGPELPASAAPLTTVKLIFVHHSTGEDWLADYGGQLGRTLGASNYFVSDTNYGWGPGAIGDYTDIGHWWRWFRGSGRGTYLTALYQESGKYSDYTRGSDPGGENQIVMFKSCFPNSHISGRPTDPPWPATTNPLRGKDASSRYMTVANVKRMYNDLLAYFRTRPDKLFVLIASPPLVEGDTDATHAANARAVNDWLVTTWLRNYPYKNVAVFDFFTVLTSNGGSVNRNDVLKVAGNHHRYRNGRIEHTRTVASNFSAYGSGDSHPTAAGGRKASSEFVGLLNVYYNAWRASRQTGESR